MTLRIEHIAIWTEDLQRLVEFYGAYFGATAGPVYVNSTKGFQSRFLSFEGGARIELMTSSTLNLVKGERGAQRHGLTHVALSMGAKQAVDELTLRLRQNGYDVVDGPRQTGDGYYESVVLDPDGNRIEITL
jgi:lactoylglutathione lyase